LNSKLADSANTQLETFRELGYFTIPIPTEPKTIIEQDAKLQQVERFVFGNCAHCHHGQIAADFRPEVFLDNTVNKPPQASGITVPDGWMRIVPGDPEKSVIYLQTRATNLPEGMKAMPPIGVQFPPEDELDNMRLWIETLPAQ
jgi:hypothetical protein